jgi:hypothetical protein
MPDTPDSLIDYVRKQMPEVPGEHLFSALESGLDWMETHLASSLRATEQPVAAINTAQPPTNLEAMRRYVPSFTVDVIDGVGHAGILLRKTPEFDSRLLAIVDGFMSA